MRILLCLCFLTLSAATRAGQAQVQRPALQSVLMAHAQRYHIAAQNLLQAMAQISSELNIPAGIIWTHPVDATRKISGDWTDTSWGDVIKDIVAQDPAYQVEISNDVVHIQPIENNLEAKNVVDVRLPFFTSSDEYTLQVSFRLRDQLNELFTLHPPPPPACAGSSAVGAGETRISMELKNPKVRDVLDDLVVNSNFSMWLVLLDSKTVYKGYIGTGSIWRKTTEADQPNWDFIQRYYDPVQMKYRGDWGFRN